MVKKIVLPKLKTIKQVSLNNLNERTAKTVRNATLSKHMQSFNALVARATQETTNVAESQNKQHERSHMNNVISQSIERNQQDFLESKLELTQIVKKDGRITLEPTFKKPDTFQQKLKARKPIYFRVKIQEMEMAAIAIKVDLRSFEEVNMAIKQSSMLKSDNKAIKHFEIPFTVCMSTEREQPCPFKDDVFVRFADSDVVMHKINRYR